MGGKEGKKEEKRLKVDAKIAKAEVKARAKSVKAEAKVRSAEIEAEAALARRASLPEGIGIAIREKDAASELVVSGLKKHQLERLLPQINKEILITLTEEKNTLRAGMMRFVREGVFQTIIKVVAGLIVGYLLLKFGMS